MDRGRSFRVEVVCECAVRNAAFSPSSISFRFVSFSLFCCCWSFSSLSFCLLVFSPVPFSCPFPFFFFQSIHSSFLSILHFCMRSSSLSYLTTLLFSILLSLNFFISTFYLFSLSVRLRPRQPRGTSTQTRGAVPLETYILNRDFIEHEREGGIFNTAGVLLAGRECFERQFS